MSEIEHDFTEFATCPYCGCEYTESYDLEESDTHECADCGEEYETERHEIINYTTSKIEKPPKPYQPSNGTEGDAFTQRYCMQCQHCNPDPEGKKQCDILMLAFAYSPSDDKYPKEWIYGEDEKPTCTNHQQWDWEKQGDPDDPENPNYLIPHNPNQTTLFS